MVATKTPPPPPQRVQYNDWRQVEVPAPGVFRPQLPVSVILPYYAQSAKLARTLAALECQTYPPHLVEVVVVDDGSPEPAECPRSTPLNITLVRQEDRGFRLAAARNAGVRAAAHDVLVFLDADMMPEADWLGAHARWHHVLPDALTLGARTHVPADGLDASAIRSRRGTISELLADAPTPSEEDRWREHILDRTDQLTTRTDEVYELVVGANLGIRRAFFDRIGGFDESFTQWGGEDTEFGWRAFVQGGLLVPVQEARAWHQGVWDENRAGKEQSLRIQQARMAHLIAHPWRRTGLAGRSFAVPQYVVTIPGGDLAEAVLLKAVDRVLSGPMHDLVVRLELGDDHPGRGWLTRVLGPDPRLRVAPARTALAEFPASPFHITLPGAMRLHSDVVRRMRAELGDAAMGQSVFPDGTCASITRAWALCRAQRTPWQVSEFGDVVTIPARKLLPMAGPDRPASASWPDGRKWTRLRDEWQRVTSPAAAWRFMRWLGYAGLWRLRRQLRGSAPQKDLTPPAAGP